MSYKNDPTGMIASVGAVVLAWFVTGLRGGWSLAAAARRRSKKTVETPGGRTAGR